MEGWKVGMSGKGKVPMTDHKAPLSRFTVLDLTRVRSGPTAVRQLADWGANVIKIEPPEHVDKSKGMGGARNGPDFQNLHRNKRGLRLDLEKDQDRSVAADLLRGADVAVFDSSFDDLERLGLDAGCARRTNPALLHVSLPHYGAPGPWSALPADDTLLWGMSGAAFAQFSWEDVPVQLVTPQLRYAHGMLAATAIAAGLY